MAAAGWRDTSPLLFALVAYLLAGVSASPGRRPFLPDHCNPLILYPIALQWSERTERVSIEQNKQKQTTPKQEGVAIIPDPPTIYYLSSPRDV